MKHSTVHSVIKKIRYTGTASATVRATPNTRKLKEEHVESLRRWIDEDCSITLKHLVAKLYENHNVAVSISTVSRAIEGFHYTFKRMHNVAARAVLPSAEDGRKEYAENFIQLRNEYADDSIVFIDEVGFQVSMRANKNQLASLVVNYELLYY